MLQSFVHYGIHFILPLIIAAVFFKKIVLKAFVIMLLGLLIDFDHALANPVFDPNRCSINFHPLHSYYAIILYVLLSLPKKTRLIGLGLVIHIIADCSDCLMMNYTKLGL